jgi:sec-independent protein translocase protein TatC
MPDEAQLEAEMRGGQMSFLEHLDELRKRLVNSVIIIVLAFFVCWYFSGTIFEFLSVPIRHALSEAARRELPVAGMTGNEAVLPVTSVKEGDKFTYSFDKATKLGTAVIQPGTTVSAIAARDSAGVLGVFTNEPLLTANAIIPTGIRLPIDLSPNAVNSPTADEQLIVTTTPESFTLYVTVSLYAAIALSVPLLLWQIWGFISPALYKHERAYVTPFILLSSVSFILGVAFAYYILFPPAIKYLLGLAENFRPLLRATDYFDFITIVMLAMGLIFQMPAISYVLARIGIISAGLLIRSWKIAIVIILIVAAVVSPTGDIPNMMLFAAPMLALYVVSIFVAWFFCKKRVDDAGAAA